MVSWADASGNLWIFGGEGLPSTRVVGDLNDLWVYNGLPTAAHSPLPLELVSFSAQKFSHSVQLYWRTINERGVSLFYIERSSNGRNFNRIGTVQAKGNTTSESNYSFTDNNPLSSLDFYRLKEVDADNKFTYSQIVVINIDQSMLFEVFPNPARDVLNLQYNLIGTEGKVQISDATGRVVKEIQLQVSSNTTSILIDVSMLPKGFYFLRIGNQNLKFIKE